MNLKILFHEKKVRHKSPQMCDFTDMKFPEKANPKSQAVGEQLLAAGGGGLEWWEVTANQAPRDKETF